MWESLKRVFNKEPQPPKELSIELQKSLVRDMVHTSSARFDSMSGRVMKGEIATSRLEFDVISSLGEDISKTIPMLSSEMIGHLRTRSGGAPDASPEEILTAYLKTKLKPQVEALNMRLSELNKAASEQEHSIAERIAEANKRESAQANDLSKMLKNRPDQHDILQGTIQDGVYAGTALTPAILVDGSEKRDESFDEPARLSAVLKTVKSSVDKQVAALKAMTENARIIRRTEALLLEAIKTARTLLPVTDAPLPSEWKGKKITLQHMIQAGHGTPSAQSLLAGYILERAGSEGYLTDRVRMKRGSSETGAHAFAEYRGLLIDPSVSDEPMDAHSEYPDRFYNV